jgi:pyridoxamine 5'-phosphate oxidase
MSRDPFALFQDFFDEAKATGILNPNALALSTVGPGGQPSSRQVLLKHFDERGFVFYTNLDSRKGREMAANVLVALNFYWRETEKQVSIHGRVEPVSGEEADDYFAGRPRLAQLGAWASLQSEVLPNRAELLARVAKYEARFFGRAVPRPPHWQGRRVVPHYFEFWVARTFRLHDRFAFEPSGDGWIEKRLYP